MLEILKPYILSFIPIFVAVDAIGNIPVFISFVEDMKRGQRHRVITDSVLTATLLAVCFMFVGKWVLKLLNVTISDFQIAGGALLFIISVRLLLPGAQKKNFFTHLNKDIGVFPLGTPLVTGPAVLTTTIIMLDSFGMMATFVSLLANMLIVWLAFSRSDLILKLIGANGTRIISKIMYILLAAIAVMMIRIGITGAFIK
ncbi:MAG: MarC family protein [Candidatus Omnitrophota bacterium]|nr:MarC family protein [Candidatus Omnitrophota bacterium]